MKFPELENGSIPLRWLSSQRMPIIPRAFSHFFVSPLDPVLRTPFSLWQITRFLNDDGLQLLFRRFHSCHLLECLRSFCWFSIPFVWSKLALQIHVECRWNEVGMSKFRIFLVYLSSFCFSIFRVEFGIITSLEVLWPSAALHPMRRLQCDIDCFLVPVAADSVHFCFWSRLRRRDLADHLVIAFSWKNRLFFVCILSPFCLLRLFVGINSVPVSDHIRFGNSRN